MSLLYFGKKNFATKQYNTKILFYGFSDFFYVFNDANLIKLRNLNKFLMETDINIKVAILVNKVIFG